mgnify:CR=1 FL=1
MSDKIKYLLVSTIFALFATASVAQISVGVSGAGVQMDASGSETQDTTQSRNETLEAYVGSVFVEYDFGGFSVGVDVIPYTIDTETTTNDQSQAAVDSGTNSVSVNIENVYTLYGLVKLPMNMYVKGGIVFGKTYASEFAVHKHTPTLHPTDKNLYNNHG